MKTLTLLFAIVLQPLTLAAAQEPGAPAGAIVASVEVSGIDTNDLSPGLRQDIDTLAGMPLDLDRVHALAGRIEAERPDVTATARAAALADGRARVTFAIADLGGDLDANINARYEVESVAVEGIPDTRVSQQLRDDMQALVGTRFVPSDAERLNERLAGELPDHDVRRRLARGSGTGRIRLVFEVREREDFRWIPFSPSRSKLVYHSTHAWSGALDVPLGGRDHRVTIGLEFGDEEGRMEHQAGYGLRIESRKLGTERLGMRFELSKHRQTWERATLVALAAEPEIPEAYRSRIMVEPSLVVGLAPPLRVGVGVSISELQSLSRSPVSQMASAATGAIGVRQRWELPSGSRHTLEASYGLRAGTRALESDLVYTRHLVGAHYRFDTDKSTAVVTSAWGRVGGAAPLFERFSLGDSATLRGWNQYDIAPAGGERMFHQSLEYRYRGFAVFTDAGSVWRRNSDPRVRASAGFGYHGDHGFVTFGFPLNAGEFRAAFMTGVRF